MTEAPAHPIVGVGASAGGVEALEGFFRGMPEKPGVGIVVVTHLNPDYRSHLHEILAQYTGMPVHVAADAMPVAPDTVYVLPPGGILGIAGGQLKLKRDGEHGRERKPIDVFLCELAADQGETAVGVVLSGGDSDGTLGVKAIKEAGGLTLAQAADGHGPQHPSMPNSAISAGFVDFAVPVDTMGSRIAEFARSIGMPIAFDPAAVDDPANERQLDDARGEIYGVLRSQLGHDFSGYKSKTFLRRVRRRMHIIQIGGIAAYVERLRQDPQEVRALFRDLLIGVTSFFRDAQAFEHLAQQVIPKLFEDRGADEAVRVWVPGCATGEEVYSIAILLREQMDRLKTVPRVQVFATDIDEAALAVARAARYPEPLLEGITAERRRRFFTPDGGSYVVAKAVRDLCIFSPHSVIRDPPFSRIDLVSCRNLLIYLGPDVQGRVVPVFHYALRPDGYLFLGTAETIGQFGDLFAPIEKKHRIFRRRPNPASGPRLPYALPGLPSGALPGGGGHKPTHSSLALRQAVESQVLERFSPPFVVVNRDSDVTYYSARTGKYLEATAGAPTRHIMTLARRGLRLDLRAALREAVESGSTAIREGVVVEDEDGRVQMTTLTVEPLRDSDRDEPLYLVLFTDEGPVLSREEAKSRVRSQDGAAVQLERELRETREKLQSLVEEYETALEELKSSNEELVSVNEEMQSTNEELEASKEELQSVNEELQTVNGELNGKVEELDRANADLQNLFENADVAMVFLDADLVIRSFTPAVAKVFKILPGDRGRPITDLASRFSLPDLESHIHAVLASETAMEHMVDHADGGTHYLMRLSPYRGTDRRTKGVVVCFIDVTSLAEAESRQQVLIAELHHRTRNLLTVVQAIAAMTLGKGSTLKSFTDRLTAMGRVQALVNHIGRGEIDLAELIRLEVMAHAGAENGRVRCGGPPVALGPMQVQALGLAVHELATNAVKYGALKQDNGQLDIDWRLARDSRDGPCVILDWRESGVVMPPEPPARGYGRELIERALAYTLGAEAKLNFRPDGVSCRIEVPLGGRPGRGLHDKG
ncbi:MAG: chemotaxis protein CheR [Belnapia sp.]|nr:chemotaxis protein CheR [Belnapia sp.]